MPAQAPATGARAALAVPGLRQPVEVIRDRWGLNHIYAGNEDDLFMAQGYLAAKDRLFQFEMWRRRATGTVAEILGPRELTRDIGTRLHQFRGNLDDELQHYHPRGKAIIEAYVRGINAQVDEALRSPATLPIEFRMLGITPAKWTPEVVISRHQALTSNAAEEVSFTRAIGALGSVEALQDLLWLQGGPIRHWRSTRDRSQDVSSRRAEGLQRLPRHHRLRAGRRRAGIPRSGPRR